MSRLVTLGLADGIARLTMDDGRGNALSTEMLEALGDALAKAAREASVLVLRGREKVFSGGLDLPSVVTLDRPKMEAFLELFDRVHEQLLTHPTPIVTEARGSAIAGGAILLCAGDHRLVTPQGKAGITEAELGVNLPSTALEIVRLALGERNLALAAQSGAVYEGEARRELGFATEVVPPEHLETRALELARVYAGRDPRVAAALRQQIRGPAVERARAHMLRDRTTFLDLWFAPPTHARLRAIADRLSSRR